jgi:hypothetical protein
MGGSGQDATVGVKNRQRSRSYVLVQTTLHDDWCAEGVHSADPSAGRELPPSHRGDLSEASQPNRLVEGSS